MTTTEHSIFDSFLHATWPSSLNNTIRENEFNKSQLLSWLSSISNLTDIESSEESDQRKPDAKPFFGWRACTSNQLKINGNVKTDLIFKKNNIFLLIENKIIREDKNEECNIKNAIVQTIEYLNLYNVSAAILLIFDSGKAKDREWDNSAEEVLIKCITSHYPLCIVRVRNNFDTKVYYHRQWPNHGMQADAA